MALGWVTAAWSGAISASLTLALVNALVWARDRKSWSNLLFATASVANSVLGVMELGIMRTSDPERMLVALRWVHVPFLVTLGCLVGFVLLYLRAGRPWLAWAVIGTRAFASIVLNFQSPGSINFTAVDRVIPVLFLGETVWVPDGVVNPWVRVGQLSSVLFLVFVVDAGVTVWRRGDRRRALTVCGGLFLFICMAAGHVALVNAGKVRSPYILTFAYLGVLLAMAQELSADVVRARELARKLQESEAEARERERRMNLAAKPAEIALRAWDIPNDSIRITPGGRALYGVSFDVTPLKEAERELLRQHGELAGRGVAVTTELAPDLPAVSGDRVQLQQVLLSLVINASDAIAGLESVDRRLRVRAERDGDGGVRISVSDRGCRIPADRLEAVFEPFVTTKAEGLGLGLAVWRKIVRAHGGEIRAENNVEGTPGATLRLFLPGTALVA